MSSSHPQKGLSLASLSVSLGSELAKAVAARQEEWDTAGCTQRLWQQDASLWTNTDESRWLGWLTIVEQQLAGVSRFKALAAEIAEDGFAHMVVLGMGGSSLCPEVFAATFGKQINAPHLLVHDSTDPAQVRALRAKIDPARTLFCVSSKSGTALEPNLSLQYFYEETRHAVGVQAGHHFVAVTDAGSKLEGVAHKLGFRRVYYGAPNICNRYSALSDFGLIPHTAMGLDTERLLKRTRLMVQACQNTKSTENPGVSLGLILGTAATRFGRDKVTLICSPSLQKVGAWLAQLLADSTGTQGGGLIPVDREPVLAPEAYGRDRIFAHLQYASDADPNQAAVDALAKAGQPLVRLVLKDLNDVGQLFFQWEMATAVAGSVMGINVFEQPNVEANKVVASGGADEKPIVEHEGIKLFTDKGNDALLGKGKATLGGLIRKHLDGMKGGDYFGLLAYLPMLPENEAVLLEIRRKILEAKQVATVLTFGPQSIGHNADRGVFLQITCEEAEDLQVPHEEYTFGDVKAALARRDFQALMEGQRRLLRIHLGKDVKAGLARLHDLVSAAVAH